MSDWWFYGVEMKPKWPQCCQFRVANFTTEYVYRHERAAYKLERNYQFKLIII